MATLTMEFLNSTQMQKIFRFELYKIAPQDKEDVKHECIVKILKALKRTKNEIPEDKLPSFCHTIIKRTVVDYIRKSVRKIERNTIRFTPDYIDSPYIVDAEVEDFYGVRYTFIREKDLEYIRNQMRIYTDTYNQPDLVSVRLDYERNRDKLSPKERKVLDYVLYNADVDGMNMVEIANELQINKSHVTRAYKKLREICSCA